jgi:hypothetical protein
MVVHIHPFFYCLTLLYYRFDSLALSAITKHVESMRNLILYFSLPQFSDIALAVAELKRMPILATIRGLLTNDATMEARYPS